MAPEQTRCGHADATALGQAESRPPSRQARTPAAAQEAASATSTVKMRLYDCSTASGA